jgi:hypothetical protein
MAIDLGNIKEQIQGIFETANTTTASVDLSNGLLTRVQKVLKVNPARIPVQASFHPFVTVYVDNKGITPQDIAVNQTNSKRRAEVDIKIAGAVWNNIYVNPDVDDADDDCESLMENIEQILRANPTLAGTVTWSFPNQVTYHTTNLDSNVNLRAGILNLKTTIFY